jgi:hypothetical protein
LSGHIFLHLLEVEKLRAFLHSVREFFFEVVAEGFQLRLVAGLPLYDPIFAFLAEHCCLFVEKVLGGLELVLVCTREVVVLLVVSLLHLIDLSCLQFVL